MGQIRRQITAEDKEKVLVLYKEGVNINEIFKITGINLKSVGRILKNDGVYDCHNNKANKLTKEEKDQIPGLYLSGVSMNEIAKKFNVTADTICYYIKKAGIEFERKTHKLNKDEINCIAEDFHKGMSLNDLAAKYNVSVNAIIYQLNALGIRTPESNAISSEVVDNITKEIKSGKTANAIAQELDVSYHQVKYIGYRDNLDIAYEDKTGIKKEYSKEITEKVIQLTQDGLTREEVVDELDLTTFKVRKILKDANFTFTPEERYERAYKGLLKRNPFAMEDVRKTITPESTKRRIAAIKKTYKNNPELCEHQRENTKKWWASLSEEDKNEYLLNRKESCLKSEKVAANLARLSKMRGNK